MSNGQPSDSVFYILIYTVHRAPNEECLGKRLEWCRTVVVVFFPFNFSAFKGNYAKAKLNTVRGFLFF